MYKVLAFVCLIALAAAHDGALVDKIKQAFQEINNNPCYKDAAENIRPEIEQIVNDYKTNGKLNTQDKIDAFNALSKYYEDVQSCDTNGRFLAQSPLDLLKGYFDKNELELWTYFFEVTGKCFSDVGAMLNFVQIYELDPSDEQQDVIIAIIEAYYGRGTYELCKDVPYIVRELLTNN